MHQSNLSRSLKLCGRICPSALATVYEQPFLLPHQYGTGNVQCAALFSKTSSSNHAVFTLLYVPGQPVPSSSWTCDSSLTWCTHVRPSTHIY